MDIVEVVEDVEVFPKLLYFATVLYFYGITIHTLHALYAIYQE